METMTVERVINAPVNEVFAWLTTTTDYTRSPLVLRCTLTRHGEGTPYGVGAVRSHLCSANASRTTTRPTPPSTSWSAACRPPGTSSAA
ncbi:SRPBCC family protein [Streptomyces lydicus]|uniref:SRPBCC family protein n=1 Tax=Streptomyces lydicus TaxID=47763 RepID=UPI002E2FDE2A|nr:SRPBCC family protein [Streptomyces lydicus]